MRDPTPGDWNRRTVLRGLGPALTVGVAGCSSDGGTGPNTVEMTDDLRFDPESLEVAAGTTVTWTNVGSVGHTVTAREDGIPEDAEYFASGGFDSEAAARDKMSEGLIDEGESYEHTFEVPGRYEYYCIPHESAEMEGTVRVTE